MAQRGLIVAFGMRSWLFSWSSVPSSHRACWAHEGMDVIPNPLPCRLLFILAQHRARHCQVFLSSKRVYARPSSLKHPKKQQSSKANCCPFLSLTLTLLQPETGAPRVGLIKFGAAQRHNQFAAPLPEPCKGSKSGESFFRASIRAVEKEQQRQSLQKSVYLVNTWVVIGNFTSDHLQVNYPHTY